MAPETPETHRNLTPKETTILKLIAEGLTPAEIAAKEGTALKTILCHRYRLMSKLAIKTDAKLMRYALRNRLVKL